MGVIVRDAGFCPEDWSGGFAAAEDWREGMGLDLGPDADLEADAPKIALAGMVRVAFTSFADGRGFTLARRLRLMGYSGRLRAAGHVIADQYAMARRAGFDEVEISDEIAERQPEEQWLRRSNWRAHDYQARLRA